jgi:hypothetical protein
MSTFNNDDDEDDFLLSKKHRREKRNRQAAKPDTDGKDKLKDPETHRGRVRKNWRDYLDEYQEGQS